MAITDLSSSNNAAAANNAVSHLCQYCGTTTAYWCSQCHRAWYCTVEHMQLDWPNHRMYCRPFDATTAMPTSPGSASFRTDQVIASFPLSTSSMTAGPAGSVPLAANPAGSPSLPSSTYRTANPVGAPTYQAPTSASSSTNTPTASFDALLFPANEERPRVVRVQCLARAQSSGPTIWTPIPEEYLGEPEGGIVNMIITNGIGGAPLRFPLHVFYGANSFSDGSPINRVIHRMTNGKATYPWAGNVLALKFSGTRRQGYTEATYNDVAPLIASFLARSS